MSRDGYRTPEAFEDDVYRIFDNCIQYLGHNFKPLYLKYAESGQKAFRKLYGAWAKKIKERNPNYVTVLSASKKQLAQAALTALNQGNISTSQVGGSPDRGGNPNSMSYSSISPVPGDSGGGSHVPQDINGIAESIKFQVRSDEERRKAGRRAGAERQRVIYLTNPLLAPLIAGPRDP